MKAIALIAILGVGTVLISVCPAETGKEICEKVDQLLKQKNGGENLQVCQNYLRNLSRLEFDDFINNDLAPSRASTKSEGLGLRMLLFAKCYLDGPLHNASLEEVIVAATDSSRPVAWRGGLIELWADRLKIDEVNLHKKLESAYIQWEKAALASPPDEMRNQYARQAVKCAVTLLQITIQKGGQPELEQSIRAADIDKAVKLIGDAPNDLREWVQTAVSVSERVQKLLTQVASSWPEGTDKRKEADCRLKDWCHPK